jgi:hypothetical protein
MIRAMRRTHDGQPMAIWTGEWMFVLTIGVLIATPVTMFLWLRRRGWM